MPQLSKPLTTGTKAITEAKTTTWKAMTTFKFQQKFQQQNITSSEYWIGILCNSSLMLSFLS